MLESNELLTALHTDGKLDQLLEGAVSPDAPELPCRGGSMRELAVVLS